MRSEGTNGADVVVVGGGLAGLTAAALLARAGRRVTLFEAGHLGGRAATQERSGFRFNLGPHALYLGGALRRVLQRLDVAVTGGMPAGEGVLLQGDEQHLLPRDAEGLAHTTLFGSEAARTEAVELLAALPALEGDELDYVEVGAWLERVRHPEARQLLEVMIRLSTFSGDPRQSLGAVAAQFRQAQAGVLYLDGGWASMVAGLEQAAREAGAEIWTGTPVTGVEHDGAVRGVRLADGSFQPATTVVLAVTPDVAARLAGPEAGLDQWAEAAIPVRVASLDLGLRRLPRPEMVFALGLDQPLYLSVHSAVAQLAPEGGALIHASRYLPADEEGGSEAELEALLDQLQPGWRDEVVERRFLRHVNVTGAVPTAELGGTAGRPGPAVPASRRTRTCGSCRWAR